MTGSVEALDHVKVFVKSQNIKSACGNFHFVQGKGDINFHFSTREVKKIEDLLYVPSLYKKNAFYRKSNGQRFDSHFMSISVFCLISKEL